MTIKVQPPVSQRKRAQLGPEIDCPGRPKDCTHTNLMNRGVEENHGIHSVNPSSFLK